MTRTLLAFAAVIYLLSGCASLKELGTTLGLKGGEEKTALVVTKPVMVEAKPAPAALPAPKGAEPPSPAKGRVATAMPEKTVIFSGKEECLTALRAGLAAPYVPKFLGNKGKRPVGKGGREAKPSEADMCVLMLTTHGKKWVYQQNGTVFRFEKDAETPYALDACGNEVYEWAHLPPPAPVVAPAPSPVEAISTCEAKSQTWNFMVWDRGNNMDPSLHERLVRAEHEKGYFGPDAGSRGLGPVLLVAKEAGKAKLSSATITAQVARLEGGKWLKVGEVKILDGSASWLLPKEAWGKKVAAVFEGNSLVYPPVDTKFGGKRVLVMTEVETTPRGCDPKYLHVATDKK
jgi:hypothetical protein